MAKNKVYQYKFEIPHSEGWGRKQEVYIEAPSKRLANACFRFKQKMKPSKCKSIRRVRAMKRHCTINYTVIID